MCNVKDFPPCLLTFCVLAWPRHCMTLLWNSMGMTHPCSWNKIVNIFYFVSEKPTYIKQGKHWTLFTSITFWLKLSDCTIRTFLRWLNWYTIAPQIHTWYYLSPIQLKNGWNLKRKKSMQSTQILLCSSHSNILFSSLGLGLDFWWCHGIFPSLLMQCTLLFQNDSPCSPEIRCHFDMWDVPSLV